MFEDFDRLTSILKFQFGPEGMKQSQGEWEKLTVTTIELLKIQLDYYNAMATSPVCEFKSRWVK